MQVVTSRCQAVQQMATSFSRVPRRRSNPPHLARPSSHLSLSCQNKRSSPPSHFPGNLFSLRICSWSVHTEFNSNHLVSRLSPRKHHSITRALHLRFFVAASEAALRYLLLTSFSVTKTLVKTFLYHTTQTSSKTANMG